MNEHDKLLLLTNSTNCNRHVPSLMMILRDHFHLKFYLVRCFHQLCFQWKVGENNELNKTLNESDLEQFMLLLLLPQESQV